MHVTTASHDCYTTYSTCYSSVVPSRCKRDSIQLNYPIKRSSKATEDVSTHVKWELKKKKKTTAISLKPGLKLCQGEKAYSHHHNQQIQTELEYQSQCNFDMWQHGLGQTKAAVRTGGGPLWCSAALFPKESQRGARSAGQSSHCLSLDSKSSREERSTQLKQWRREG